MKQQNPKPILLNHSRRRHHTATGRRLRTRANLTAAPRDGVECLSHEANSFPADPMSMDDFNTTAIRPELALLLACARPHADERIADRVRQLVLGDLNWPYLLALAEDQGVTPLLDLHLSRLAPGIVPEQWRTRLREQGRSHVFFTLSLAAELIRIVSLFREHGIEAVPYKGPALAVQAYANPALRQYSDLDLVLRHRDVLRAGELLAARGYESGIPLAAAAAGKVPGQFLFLRKGSRSVVELHTERTLRYFPRPLDLDSLMARLDPVSLDGCELRVFSAQDTLAMLAVHGSKHFWERLMWVSDIAALAQREMGMDWSVALHRARELGARRMVFLALRLAADLLDARLPEEVSKRVGRDAVAARLAAQVCDRLFRDTRALPGAIERAWFRIGMRGNLFQGVPYFLRLTLAPTEEDWAAADSPAPLRILRAVLRPARLLRKYGLGLGRRRAADLAPFLPLPMWAVERMLSLAEPGPDDILYDLGCGDGRIVIEAAKRFGARGVGVDLDPRALAAARARARSEGVETLVTFLERDARTVDLSPATIVTLYLGPVANVKLSGRLRGLRPGSRIVSCDGDIPGWPPDRRETISSARGEYAELFFWKIGAAEERESKAAASS